MNFTAVELKWFSFCGNPARTEVRHLILRSESIPVCVFSSACATLRPGSSQDAIQRLSPRWLLCAIFTHSIFPQGASISAESAQGTTCGNTLRVGSAPLVSLLENHCGG